MAYAELTLDQGTTFSATIELTNDDNTPIDVTDCEFSAQVRKSFYSGNTAAELTVTAVDTPNGVITLSLSAEETSNVKPGRYLYDLKMLNSANVTSRVIEGILTVTPQVTR